MLAAHGADFEDDVAELVAAFGAHAAEPGVLLAGSGDGEGVAGVEDGHGLRVDETVGEKYGQGLGGWSQKRPREPDGLGVVNKDVAVNLVTDFRGKVDEAENRWSCLLGVV